MTQTISKLKFIVFNAQSVRNKKFELFHFIKDLNADVVFVTETHLTNNDTFSDPNFKVVRLDRDDGRKGGGVALIVRCGLTFSILPVLQATVVETCAIKLLSADGWISVVVAYFPGVRDGVSVSDFKTDIQLLFDSYPKAVIGTDLNAKHPYWGCLNGNSAGNVLFHELMGNSFEVHFPSEPTHHPHDGSTPSTIDLVFTKGINLTEPPSVDNSFASDHLPVIFELDTDAPALVNTPRLISDYGNTNWRGYSNYIQNKICELEIPLGTPSEIDDAIDTVTRITLEADDEYVPKKEIPVRGVELTPEILDLIRQKRSRRRSWQRSRDPLVKAEIRVLSKRIDFLTTEMINGNFGKALERLNRDPGPNKRKFWKITRFMKNRPKPMPALKVNNVRLVTDEERADAFADHIDGIQKNVMLTNGSRATTRLVNQSIQELNEEQSVENNYREVTMDEIQLEIRSLKNHKAPGPDQIRNEHIKHFPDTMLLLLVTIFNSCLACGYFPDIWKIATYICILKSGKLASQVNSYRLISLISCLGKLFERILLNRIRDTIEDRGIFIPEQYGFVQGKSCTHQLFRTTKFIKKQLARKKSVGMLCLDLKSAFDVVWHNALVHKMKRFGFPANMTKMIRSFLCGRRSRVLVGNTKSKFIDTKAGVPQGSVLSPTLFNIFTSDIPDVNGEYLAQFADDQAIAVTSHKTSAIKNKLQKISNRLTRYFKRWRISVNAQKSELVLFTNKRAARHNPRGPVMVDGSPVHWQSSLKYLGLRLDRKMTYKDHVTMVCEKLGRVIRALYPLIGPGSKLAPGHKLTLFKSIFRPTCTYAAPVWLNCAKTHILRLQRLQNRFLKLVLGLPMRTSTSLVHSLANVVPLHEYLKKLEDGFIISCRSNINNDINELVE